MVYILLKFTCGVVPVQKWNDFFHSCHVSRDVTQSAKIRICRMRISCTKSAGCRFVAWSNYKLYYS